MIGSNGIIIMSTNDGPKVVVISKKLTLNPFNLESVISSMLYAVSKLKHHTLRYLGQKLNGSTIENLK